MHVLWLFNFNDRPGVTIQLERLPIVCWRREAWGKLTEVGHVVLFISDVVPMMVVCSEVVMLFASGRLVLDSRVLRDCGTEQLDVDGVGVIMYVMVFCVDGEVLMLDANVSSVVAIGLMLDVVVSNVDGIGVRMYVMVFCVEDEVLMMDGDESVLEVRNQE